MWSQVRQVTVLWSRYNYIPGTDQRRFELVGIQGMRNFSSYHFALRSQLLQRPTHCHARYLWWRIAFLLILSPITKLIRANTKFQNLKTLEPVPPNMKRPHCPLWLSPYSIQLIGKRTALQQNPRHSQSVARGITRSVRWSLMADTWRWVEEAATEIGACLDTSTGVSDSQRVNAILKPWYRHASARVPNPS